MSERGTCAAGDGRNSEEWWAGFRKLLADQQDWPNEYVFKFIVPREGLEELEKVFSGEKITVRASSRGKYLSVTARYTLDSPDAVIAVYEAAGRIRGVISL